MILNKELIDQAFNQARGYYYPDYWIKIAAYFGEETAEEFDYLGKFDYEGVYEKGDLKECEVYHSITLIQQCMINMLFDNEKHDNFMPSYVYLQYWNYKLFDKYTGKGNHLWLN